MLSVENVSKSFRAPELGRRGHVDAVRNVSLEVRTGQILGIVGESGSGKTTLARIMGQLVEPTEGRVCLRGTDLAGSSQRLYTASGARSRCISRTQLLAGSPNDGAPDTGRTAANSRAVRDAMDTARSG